MVSAAKVTPRQHWTLDDLHALQPSVDASPWGPLASAADVLAGSFLFEFEQGGAHALIALRPNQFAHGVRLDVVGLVSTGDRLPVGALDVALLGIAGQFGADQLAMCTARPHVERQALRSGWQKTGVVMTRKLYVEQ